METSALGHAGHADNKTTESIPNSVMLSGKEEHATFQVTLLDPDIDPKNLPLWRKWLAVIVINAGAICVSSSSSMAAFAQAAIAQEFNVNMTVTVLGVSLFTIGLGIGPLLVGALAELFGQRPIYLGSYFLLWVFTWPVAFAHSVAVYMIFRFLGGVAGSAFLSIGGGTISDMFTNESVSTPMASYVVSTFIAPNFGPLFTGFVAQYAGWRWIYHVLIIWEFVQGIALLFIPETYYPVLLKRKAKRLRQTTGDDRYHAPGETNGSQILQDTWIGFKNIVELIVFDQMALLLDIWLALLLAIIYLASQAFPIIFVENHNFTPGMLGLTFIGLDIGFLIALATQPLWNRYQSKLSSRYNTNPPPEMWLRMGQAGGILTPVGLYIMAFTTYKHVHWIAPIIGSIPFGTGVCYVYTSTLTYFATAYRPMASAVMSGSAILRATLAGCFPLFASAMYHRLGTVGATALLAGLTTMLAPLPFIFERFGARIRAKSRFAFHE